MFTRVWMRPHVCVGTYMPVPNDAGEGWLMRLCKPCIYIYILSVWKLALEPGLRVFKPIGMLA